MVLLECGLVKGYDRNGRSAKVWTELDGAIRNINLEKLDHGAAIIADRVRSELPQVDLIIGLAGRGIVPALAVAQQLRCHIQIAYKNRLDLSPELQFTEPHSNSPTLYFYPDPRNSGRNALLVDDEITSGSTAVNAARALESHGIKVLGVAALVERREFDCKQVLETAQLKLISLFDSEMKGEIA